MLMMLHQEREGKIICRECKIRIPWGEFGKGLQEIEREREYIFSCNSFSIIRTISWKGKEWEKIKINCILLPSWEGGRERESTIYSSKYQLSNRLMV